MFIFDICEHFIRNSELKAYHFELSELTNCHHLIVFSHLIKLIAVSQGDLIELSEPYLCSSNSNILYTPKTKFEFIHFIETISPSTVGINHHHQFQ